MTNKSLSDQEGYAREVSFRAIRRYLPNISNSEVLAIRWVFLTRENEPTLISLKIIELAEQLINSFLRDPRYSALNNKINQLFVLSIARRYYCFNSKMLKSAIWYLAFKVSFNTYDGMLLLRYLWYLYQERR